MFYGMKNEQLRKRILARIFRPHDQIAETVGLNEMTRQLEFESDEQKPLTVSGLNILRFVFC
jgi:hypothetical protein